MAKKIKLADLVFKVGDDNTLKVFASNAKKAGKELKNVEKAQDETTYATKKGINQTANQTKNFANMARGISGSLVPAYATLAANVFALTAVFGFLKQAADYRVLKEGQAAYAGVTGIAYKNLTNSIIDATDAQIRYTDAAQAAAIGTAAGLSPEQMEKLGAAAKTVSIALGRDVTDSFNRLVRGTTKAEPELLDELGIILRLDTATRAYADALGVSKESLNAFQRTQAVTNDVLKQVEDKFSAINAIMDPQTNKINKLTKAFDDLMNKVRDLVAGPAEMLAVFFSENLGAAIGALGLFALPILQSILPAFDEMAANAEQNLARHNAALEEAKTQLNQYKDTSKAAQMQATRTFSSMQKKAQDFAGQAGLPMGRKGSGLRALQEGREISPRQAAAIRKQIQDRNGAYFVANKRLRNNWVKTLKEMETAHKISTGKIKVQATGVRLWWKKQSAAMLVGWKATMKGMSSAAATAGKFISRAFAIFSYISLGLLLFDALKAGAEKLGLFGGEAGKADESIEGLIKRQKELNKELDKMFEDRDTLKDIGAPFRTMVKNAGNLFVSANFGTDIQKLNEIKAAQAALEATGGIREGFDPKNVRGIRYRKQIGTEFKSDFTGKVHETPIFESGPDLTAEEQKYATLMNQETEYRRAVAETLKQFGDEFPTVLNAINEKGLFTGEMKDGKLVLNEEVGDLVSILTKGSAAVDGLDQGAQKFSQSITANFGKASTKVLFYRDALQRANFEQDILLSMQTANREKPGTYTEEQIQAQTAAKNKAADFAEGIGGSVNAARLLTTETARLAIQKESIANKIYAGTILGKQQQVRNQMLQKEAEITQLLDEIAYRTANVKKGDEETNRQEIADMQSKVALLREQKLGLENSINLTRELGVVATEAFANSMQKGIQGVIEGTMSIKDAFKSMAVSILQSLAQVLAKMMTMKILSSMFGIPGIPMANGGIIPMAKGGIIKGYQHGGIAKEPTYLVGEAGPEAVVPLPDGRSIPVNMSGAAGNNITINVDASGQSTTTMDGERGKALGVAIQAAVMETIQREKRPGGVLSGN